MAEKVFITGGAGFIGFAVAKNLIKNGFEVRLFDLMEPPESIGEFKRGTIMYTEEVFRAMEGCDYVIHLAAMLGVKKTENDYMGTLDVNIQGTKNVLDAAVKAGIKKIVFSSSSEVYGESPAELIDETVPVQPKSVYGVSKLAGEEYVKAAKQKYGIDYTIVRFFNVYGPRQVAEFVMPRFIKAVLDGEQPTIYGKGDQERSFCYVKDAAEGVRLALTTKAANGETLNIGNDLPGVTVTVAELAKKVIALSGKNIEPKYIELDKSNNRTEKREIIRRKVSISKARSLLGYEPKVSIDEGIKEILEIGNIRPTW